MPSSETFQAFLTASKSNLLVIAGLLLVFLGLSGRIGSWLSIDSGDRDKARKIGFTFIAIGLLGHLLTFLLPTRSATPDKSPSSVPTTSAAPTSPTVTTAPTAEKPKAAQPSDSAKPRISKSSHPEPAAPTDTKPTPQPSPVVGSGTTIKQGGNGNCQANAIGGSATVHCEPSNPYKPVKIWQPDGSYKIFEGGNVTVDGPYSESAGTIVQRFINAGNFQGLESWSETQRAKYPDFFLPDMSLAIAETGLCKLNAAEDNFNKFLQETADAPSWEGLRELAQEQLTRLPASAKRCAGHPNLYGPLAP